MIFARSGRTTGELIANVPTMSVSRSDRPQLGGVPDVAEAFAHLALLAPERRSAVELAGAHHQQGGDDEHERDRVQREAHAGTDGDDQHAAEGGTEDARNLEDGAAEADRVGEILRRDELGHERLPRRVVDRERQAEHEHDRVEHPELHDAREVDHREQHGHRGHGRLRDEQDGALVEAVRDHSSPHAEQERRDELERNGEPDGEAAVVREVQHQPAQGDGLHPGTALGDQLTNEEQPEVPDVQRLERAPQAHWASSWSRSRSGSARARRARSVSVSSAMRRARYSSLRVRLRASSVATGVGDEGARHPPVGGVDDAGRVAPLLEPADDAGHARRLHLLDRGELAEGDRAESLDGGQRALRGRGELLAGDRGLLADAAREPGDRQPQLRRQLGDLGALRALGGGGGGHGEEVSIAN